MVPKSEALSLSWIFVQSTRDIITLFYCLLISEVVDNQPPGAFNSISTLYLRTDKVASPFECLQDLLITIFLISACFLYMGKSLANLHFLFKATVGKTYWAVLWIKDYVLWGSWPKIWQVELAVRMGQEHCLCLYSFLPRLRLFSTSFLSHSLSSLPRFPCASLIFSPLPFIDIFLNSTSAFSVLLS